MVLLRNFLAAALLLSTAAPATAETKLEKLEIDSSSGAHVFQVEVMRTPRELEHGLMDRRYLPPERGMLFDFKVAKPIMMWMKNTYIPLDMVFIGADGAVIGAAENAEPMSERIIPSNGPALGVLEVNAGTVAKLGIKPGDHVKHAMFP